MPEENTAKEPSDLYGERNPVEQVEDAEGEYDGEDEFEDEQGFNQYASWGYGLVFVGFAIGTMFSSAVAASFFTTAVILGIFTLRDEEVLHGVVILLLSMIIPALMFGQEMANILGQ